MAVEQERAYAFVVTGASGEVGRSLIPLLVAPGRTILAVGRNPALLRHLFSHLPLVDVVGYDDLADVSACDVLIHLAAHNNDQASRLADFLKVNVGFATYVCEEFKRMGGKRFINVSTTHILEGNRETHYAQSKAAGREHIARLVGDRLDNIHMGYFYSDHSYGSRFGFLSRIGPLGRAMFNIIKILKPTTSAACLSNYVLGPARSLPAPSVLTDDRNHDRVYQATCRCFDIIVAASVLIGLLPIFVVLWVLIRISSPGPAIFIQTRVGRGEAPFKLYKFRTMHHNTLSAATHETPASAVTKIGKFLRRSKLDELPQLLNVLRGDMALVGPRPCLPLQDELVRARRALGVFSMRPGITGYAQVRHIDMSRPTELAQCDYIYMKLQSLSLDFKIVLRTVLGHGAGDHVVSREQL